MSNEYVDLDDLKQRRYFESATLDPRFVFEETEPLEEHGVVWKQFRIVDCAHRDVDREGDACGHCGKDFTPVKAPVRKRRSRK